MLGKLKISVIFKWYVLILTVNSTGWNAYVSFAVLFYTLKCPASILSIKKSIITKNKELCVKNLAFLKYKVYYQAKKRKMKIVFQKLI